MTIVYRLISISLTWVKAIIWCLILVTVFGMALPYISNVNNYTYLKPIVSFEQNMNSKVKEAIPTRIANKDLSQGITVILLLILSAVTTRTRESITSRFVKDAVAEELNQIRSKATTIEQKKSIAQFQERIKETNYQGKSRQDLLKDFVQLKKELEKTGRSLSFLAIDVVDSTGMKQGEDPVVVENDFNQYHDYILANFKEYGYIKASWTPDGVMACFNTTEQAINAAQAIIDGLPDFNSNIKTMKRDFQIRCGINTGFVYYDLSTPLEEFSDRVIDIAGHMQKNAPPNTILIAKEIVKPIKTYEDFDTGNKQIVDGFEVCEWHPK